MPNNTNSLGSLEIIDSSVSSSFQTKLNDRLRRIGSIIGKAGAAGGSGTSGSGVSQITLSVSGILAVESDVAPPFTLGADTSFSTAVMLLKRPPIGSPVSVQLFVNGTPWGGPIVTSSTSASIDVSGAGPIKANQLVRLDITGVGALLTGVSFPGSDLTVILR
jgi:hypothetical protein